jgi:hypothetical protein
MLVGGLVVINLAVHWLAFWRGGANLAVWEAIMSLLFCGTLAARSLVVCEALVGQLFPAILLARLVSMEIHHRQSRDS